MISDIVEREDIGPVEPPKPPQPPSVGATNSHGQKKISAWRARQEQRKTQGSKGTGEGLANSKIAQALSKAKTHGSTRPAPSSSKRDQAQPLEAQFSESERIHIENLERLSKMTEAEIEREREEILGNMDVNILRGLLKRAEMRDGGDEFEGVMNEAEVDQALTGRPIPQKLASETLQESSVKPTTTATPAPKKKDLSTFSIADVGVEGLNDNDERYPSFEDLQKMEAQLDEEEREKLGASNVHFPRDKSQDTDDLDPSDPQFFEKMHSKYFPTLPAEPEKMAWMQEVTDSSATADGTSPPYQDGLLPSELRFDFKGNLLSPRVSDQIPSHLGLHHHGDAPAAAGYTVLELAHLARSSAHSQRCMAIQTLGRVLYRLGKGTSYGPEISAGLWGLVDQVRVIESLQEASDQKHTKSMSVQAYAVEALWLWKQGGGSRPAI